MASFSLGASFSLSRLYGLKGPLYDPEDDAPAVGIRIICWKGNPSMAGRNLVPSSRSPGRGRVPSRALPAGGIFPPDPPIGT